MPPGIEVSNDPVLHFRSESYVESQKRRLSETKPAIKPGGGSSKKKGGGNKNRKK